MRLSLAGRALEGAGGARAGSPTTRAGRGADARGRGLKPRHVFGRAYQAQRRALRTDEVAADTHGRCRESSGSCSRQRAVRRDVQRAAPPGVRHTGARRRVKRSDGLSAMECRGHLQLSLATTLRGCLAVSDRPGRGSGGYHQASSCHTPWVLPQTFQVPTRTS